MTTATLERQREASSLIGLTAWALIAGGLLQIVLGIPLASLQAKEPALWQIAALNALSHLLLVVGVTGLAQSGALGRGRLAVTGLGLTFLGLAVLMLAEAIWVLADENTAGLYYGIATLTLMFGLILAGVAVLRAGRWSGWRRFTVLATGLFIPLILIPSFALPGYGPNYAIGFWGLCWLLVGLSLWAEAG